MALRDAVKDIIFLHLICSFMYFCSLKVTIVLRGIVFCEVFILSEDFGRLACYLCSRVCCVGSRLKSLKLGEGNIGRTKKGIGSDVSTVEGSDLATSASDRPVTFGESFDKHKSCLRLNIVHETLDRSFRAFFFTVRRL